ncbi:ShlB/FhaC/HecB family hemolysin secretion/activation protein [Laspinema olomoucense]|uniref:two-partner secretion domain-containing protein n=1 Tax=Laspinema olomoucense TaxID=3231600 RepID=UPI0021BB7C20|nr:ShlB/FhaC/HecB family hemolysin secretion/activation protein [Laspinema sp. D3d]MCT7973620.1 filamentous hemagglutinin N-terminal domain-containing protein [Laspinema sp. D3d]
MKPPVYDIKHLLALTVTISLGCFSTTHAAFSQIVPDATLPENSTVSPNGNIIEINGGTVRGNNLFHSFQEFSLFTGETVFFNNNLTLENIFSRITGGNPSNIDGVIQANGAANLFLLNSNGIVFGPNAQLNIGGSFLASTANRLNFSDGSFFSTQPTPSDSLLTISIPTTLQMDNNSAEIRVEGAGHNFSLNPFTVEIIRGELSGGLRVQPEKTLGFVAGNVTLNGGNLIAESGNIELWSVQNGAVQFNNFNGQFQLGNSVTPPEYGTIQLLNAASVDATGSRGGHIQIQGGQLLLTDGSTILNQTEGGQTGGDLIVRTSESVELIGTTLEPRLPEGFLESLAGEDGEIPSPEELPFPPDGLVFPTTMAVETVGEGNAGNLLLETGQLTIFDGASVSTSTFGAGNTGTLTIRAREAIAIEGFSIDGLPAGIFSTVTPEVSGLGQTMSIETRELTIAVGGTIATGTFGTGSAGDVTIKAANFVEVLGGVISSQTEGLGSGGNLLIETGRVLVNDGGGISASTFTEGDAGNLDIRAVGSVEVSGGFQTSEDEFFPSGIFSQVNFITQENPETQETQIFPAVGFGGNLTIDTQRVIVENGGLISASTTSEGAGGTLSINATEFIELRGIAPNGTPSGLFVITEEEGTAGNAIVNTAQLTATDGGQIAASTSGSGNGGTVTVNATEFIELRGVGILPNGEVAPPVAVLADGTVAPTDEDDILRSGIFARSRNQGLGNAGTVNVTTNELTLADDATLTVSSRLGAETAAAGDLNINAEEINLDKGILTAETNAGDSGNINIESEIVLLGDRSQITTNADSTTGGNIRIETDILAALNNSDITANARQGPGGRVTIEAQGLFGTEFRDRESFATSDITATSELGPEFDGIVEINTPDIDPSRGTVDLEDDIVDVASLIDRDPCRIVQNSEFVQTGKGGIPPSPTDTLTPTDAWEDWRVLQVEETPATLEPIPNTPSPAQTRRISKIAATGMRLTDRGELELIAPESAVPLTDQSSLSPGCLSAQQPKTLPATTIAAVPETLTVERFELRDNSAISSEELAAITEPYSNRNLTFAELQEAAEAIAQFYQQQGYIGSGAFLPPQIVRDRIVTIQAIENRLEEIHVTGNSQLNNQYAAYVRNRLGLNKGDIVNAETLLESLYLLQFDPRLEKISAELAAGVETDTSFLTIRVEDARFFSPQLAIDNGRSPSVGSLRRQAQLTQYNLLGLGDIATFNYANTDGSNSLDLGYAVPLTANNATLSFRYSIGDSKIVEPPFDEVDIEANSRTYELTYREPIIQRIISQSPNQSLQNASDLIRTELALGITASRRSSETSLLGVNFPLSPGANDDGETRVSAIRFFQDALWQDSHQILAARSEFSLGVGLFDATVNNNEPDSRFLAWRGQGQWVRRVAGLGGKRQDPLLILRGDLQLATTSLLPLEQFSLGGFNSVRGYRQDALLVDNGAFASLEFQYPIVEFPRWQGSLQVIPFMDLGVGWNWEEGNRANPDKNTLLSTGLGLQLQLGNDFSARLDWGIPLVEIDSRDRTWQENGLYFSVRWNPF